MNLRLKLRNLLGVRAWIYVLSLLVPLLAYTLTLKVSTVLANSPDSGLLGSLRLMRSDLLFGLGYALLWIGLFGVADRGIARRVVVVLFHATTILVTVVSTCAYQYLTTTGTALNYGMVVYYLGKFGEAKGAIASETPPWLLIALLAGLIYAVLGPFWITTLLTPRARPGTSAPKNPWAEAVGSGPARSAPVLTRGRFLAGGAGVAAGLLLVKESLSASGGTRGVAPRAPLSNLIATEMESSELAAASQEVGPVNTLANIRLAATEETRRRHVALIHLESVRERSSTPYNKDVSTQPYLEELARDSLLVERAYTTIPHTSKAIVSIDSGLYPHPSTDIVEARPGGVPARCLAELLGEQGYRTAWFQSATGTFEDRAQLVKNFGYGHFQAYESMKTEGFQPSNYLGYEDDIMLGPGRNWLEENADDPTLVMFMGVTPHHQYLAPTRYGRKSFANKPGLNRYLNAIRYDDFWVQNIIQMYKDLGLYEDTIFVIYGDHGESFGEHGRYQHDGVIWEEGLRIPLVIHDPQRFAGGERVEGPAHLMDFAPTLVDMLGYEVRGGEYPGHSIIGNLPEDRTLYFGCRPDLLSMASITGNEKYIYHFGNLPEEYYDLSKDPLEQRNLASKAGKKKLEQKRLALLRWHAKASATYENSGPDPA